MNRITIIRLDDSTAKPRLARHGASARRAAATAGGVARPLVRAALRRHLGRTGGRRPTFGSPRTDGVRRHGLRFAAAGIALLPSVLRHRPFPVGRLGWTRTLILFFLTGVPGPRRTTWQWNGLIFSWSASPWWRWHVQPAQHIHRNTVLSQGTKGVVLRALCEHER